MLGNLGKALMELSSLESSLPVLVTHACHFSGIQLGTQAEHCTDARQAEAPAALCGPVDMSYITERQLSSSASLRLEAFFLWPQ